MSFVPLSAVVTLLAADGPLDCYGRSFAGWEGENLMLYAYRDVSQTVLEAANAGVHHPNGPQGKYHVIPWPQDSNDIPKAGVWSFQTASRSVLQEPKQR
jgi:hypothetical protein